MVSDKRAPPDTRAGRGRGAGPPQSTHPQRL